MHDFDLLVARDLAELTLLLAEHPGARIVAGATDFIPFVQAGKWTPHVVIDITRLDELRVFRVEGSRVELGALLTHSQLAGSDFLREQATALAEAAASVADPSVRARSTLGGNVCTASPAADTVPALLVLDAEVSLTSQAGERRLPLTSFLIGPGRTALRPDEALKSIGFTIPPARMGTAFVKLGRRSSMAISIASAAASLQIDDGHVSSVRLALGAVAPTACRCIAAETALRNMPWEPESIAAGVELVSTAIHPIDDVRATAAYRRAVAPRLAGRVLLAAAQRAGVTQ